MTKFLAILADTFLEIKVRKIFYLYCIVTAIIVIFIVFMPDIEIDDNNIIKGKIANGKSIGPIVAGFYVQFYWLMTFLMIFGSAGLIPAYLSKGRVELAISKPIDRFRLISMKFLSVYFILSFVLVVSTIIVWLTIWLRIGNYTPHFFAGLGYAMIHFLVMYFIIFFFGLLSNSAAASIMGYFMIFVATTLLQLREIVYEFLGDSIWRTILDITYNILPKISEMSSNYGPLILDLKMNDWYPVWVSLVFGAVVYSIALLLFKRRDY